MNQKGQNTGGVDKKNTQLCDLSWGNLDDAQRLHLRELARDGIRGYLRSFGQHPLEKDYILDLMVAQVRAAIVYLDIQNCNAIYALLGNAVDIELEENSGVFTEMAKAYDCDFTFE